MRYLVLAVIVFCPLFAAYVEGDQILEDDQNMEQDLTGNDANPAIILPNIELEEKKENPIVSELINKIVFNTFEFFIFTPFSKIS